MSDTPEGIRIPERVVPFPRSISAAARMFAPNGIEAPPPPLPPANDLDARTELRAQVEQITMTFKEPDLTTTTSVETVDYNRIAVHVARPVGGTPTSRVYIEIHGGGPPARRDAGSSCVAGHHRRQKSIGSSQRIGGA